MSHSRNHEETIKVIRRTSGCGSCVREFREKRLYALVVVDGTQRRDRCVSPPVILKELAAFGTKGAQIRIRCVKDRASLGIPELNVAVEIESPKVPFRVFENRLPVIGISKIELNGARWICGRNPRGPGSRSRFSTGRPSLKKFALRFVDSSRPSRFA
jgi:hypothetical protein